MKCDICANRNLCKDICCETMCLGIYNFKLNNMKTYVGTKTVKAKPCTLGEFIKLTGRNPYANDGKMHGENEEGYLVEYKDGYKSWSPKDVFEEAYKESNIMTFGDAIIALKQGHCIKRKGWNGKNIYVVKQVPQSIPSEIIPKMNSLPQSAKDKILAGVGHIDYTSQCLIINETTGRADSWVPSISDVFAEDWEIYF